VLGRRNLRVESGCLAEAVEFDGRRASGVRWRQNGDVRSARCRSEVILSAGAIGSPHLLMLSGVGPAAQLAQHGIETRLDRAGVGANLQDHLQLRTIYKVSSVKTLNAMNASLFGRAGMGLDYLLRRRGPMTMAPSQLGAFTKSDKMQDRANIQYHVQPLSLEKFGEPLHPFPAFTASVANLRPTSRGSVTLKSADPAQPPAIAPNYLSTPEDRRVAADSIRVTRAIVGQQALRKYAPVEYLPGEQVSSDDEAALETAAGNIGTTIFHPVGTARMGRDDDVHAVVDARLRVIGIDGLRVIDASVMPSITSGNTNSPTMMIAEKGAAMIAEDSKR
jgi:choline dehydrogenase-like flavoprotein